MFTRFIIFARVHIGPPVNRWADNPSVMLGSETEVVEALVTGQIEGAIDRIERYDIGHLAEDASEDIALALASRVRTRMAEDGYVPADNLRDFIEAQVGVGTVLPAIAFEPARVA